MRLLKSSKNLNLYARIGPKDYNISLDNPDKGLNAPVVFSIKTKGPWSKEIGTFTLAPMPGCCGVVVSTGLLLAQKFRGTEISKEFMELKEWTAEYLGYSAVIATTQLTNKAEIISSQRRGYSQVAEWKNARTGNELILIFKQTNV